MGWTAWNILSLLLLATWVFRRFALSWGIRREPSVKPDSSDPLPQPLPRVSVLVAARNEERYIRRCAESLLAQDYPDFGVIVVDDRSSDATPDILADLQRKNPEKLEVVHVDSLPPGWKGKHHAMHLGMSRATGDWLLFTDADCQMLSPRAISAAAAEMHRVGADLFTIVPLVEMRMAWEQILQPVCAVVLMLWFLPSRVNNPKDRTAYANGAFMLMRRSAYDRIGGHEAARDALNEDILFARRIKAAGLRLYVAQNGGLYWTHMYATPRQAWHGWSRIYAGCLESPYRILLAILFLLLFSLTPWISLFLALTLQWASDDPAFVRQASLATLLWTAVILAKQWTLWLWYKMVGARGIYSLGYVGGAIAAVAILGSALIQTLGWSRTQWRGMTYGRSASAARNEPRRSGLT